MNEKKVLRFYKGNREKEHCFSLKVVFSAKTENELKPNWLFTILIESQTIVKRTLL